MEASSRESVAPLQFGETYLVPDENGREVPGVLCDGVVVEQERKAFGIYQLADGRYIHCTVPLTETELADYRRSPDTFFGVVKRVSVGVKTPVDAFDFFFESYSKTPRDKLLEFMSQRPEIDSYRRLPQRELAQVYSAQMATILWAQHQGQQPP